ncbi:MAG: DUF4097 domain-containing protein [Dysgonamonadaceae bacterium]|jgi:hypothetical protein|nr:DUF4097 domain-containing protein [Dysgonamonadaceae bacterium]
MKKYFLLIGFCCLAVFRLNAEASSRIESKSFSNVKEIRFDQVLGDIVVKESDSQQTQLEIHYYDGKKKKPDCRISIHNNILYIRTILPEKRKNEKIKINYIIAIPRGIALSVDLEYGNIEINDAFYGDFKAKLAYSELEAKAFVNTQPSISCKYGKIEIRSVEDLTLKTEYSEVEIDKAGKLELKSKYTNYRVKTVQTILPGSYAKYGVFKIGSINTINIELDYVDLFIDTVEKKMDVKCAYSEVEIKTTSKQLKDVNLNGSYSDLSIKLHPELSAVFEIDLVYGDLIISRNHEVKYKVSEEQNGRIEKKGTIGSKSPSAHIIVSNQYADVNIK